MSLDIFFFLAESSQSKRNVSGIIINKNLAAPPQLGIVNAVRKPSNIEKPSKFLFIFFAFCVFKSRSSSDAPLHRDPIGLCAWCSGRVHGSPRRQHGHTNKRVGLGFKLGMRGMMVQTYQGTCLDP